MYQVEKGTQLPAAFKVRNYRVEGDQTTCLVAGNSKFIPMFGKAEDMRA